MKFGRNYRLTVETVDGDFIVIENPSTIQFTITRSTQSTLNSMQLNVFNLSANTRDKIFQDRFNPKFYKKIVLEAGYENLSVVFQGNIFRANSRRVGTDILTFIDCRDGGFDTRSTLSNISLNGGSYKDIVKALAGSFEKIKLGDIGDITGEARRNVILSGNSFSLIKKYSNDRAFIDLEELKVLKEDEVLEGEVQVLESDTGLLGTPVHDDAYLTIDTIFEPRIIMGQLIEIRSEVAPVYDGQYKVIGVTHQGIISGAVGGEAKSTFNLLVGSQLFGGFNKV